MKILKNIFILATTAVALSSCDANLMDTNPYGSINSSKMWTTENLADQGVTSIYSTLRNDYVGLGLYKLDCFGVTSNCSGNDDAILKGNATTNSGLFSGYWQLHYEGIQRANDAIVHLPGAPLTDVKKGRLIAESKFLRAYFYYKLNMVYKGVPIYLEPIDLSKCTKGQDTEQAVWDQVIADLTDCINEPNLPNRYAKGNANVGRVTKAAAYALRGKAYLWLKKWAEAEADFRKVGDAGCALFQGGYKELFKEANEQCEEMIFSVQNIGLAGYGNGISKAFGSRVSFQQGWNTYLPSTDFVDSYECADGKKFNWDDVIPNYSTMDTKARSVYFFRDNMTAKEIAAMAKDQKADMSKYIPTGNEARILKAYNNRDPRLAATIITPYSTFLGAPAAVNYTYTLRWPYRGKDNEAPFDVRTDTNNSFYYLFRKFVAEGANEIPNREYSGINFPLIRYADVVLGLAEALNEQGKTDDAIPFVNMVRKRAGVAELNSNTYTAVAGQDNLRERIRNERRWEFNGEGVNFFDEIRWKTWKESKFQKGAGLKQIWGQSQYEYSWAGDYIYTWPVPKVERQMNHNLSLAPGWID